MSCDTEMQWMFLVLDSIGLGILYLLLVLWERRDEVKALKDQLLSEWDTKDE